MGELTVTGLDEALLERLSQRAAASGRTAEDEARHLLAVGLSTGQAMSALDMLAEARLQTINTVRTSTLALIHEGRDELP